MIFDIEEQEVKDLSSIEELKGKLASQQEEDKLLRSVIESDKKTLDQAQLLQEASNRNIGSFTPDLMYNNLVKNFAIAERLYGPKLIRLLTGYQPEAIERNLNIPEFKKELKQAIEKNVKEMKDKNLLSGQGFITEQGVDLGSLILIKQLDQFITKDRIGEKINKKQGHYGEKAETKPYRKGDRYKDLNLRKSIHKATRRLHKRLHIEDLVTATRQGRGRISIILAIDASSSMKGKKIETSKKAGIALAHKALEEKDNVGLVVFGSEIKKKISPTNDFSTLLKAISTIKVSKQTDFPTMLKAVVELFPAGDGSKHLIVLTDAMPTVGKDPKEDTLRAVSQAASAGITISLIGIQLEKEGIELAKQISAIGEGRFNLVRDLDKLGHIVLEDFYSIQ